MLKKSKMAHDVADYLRLQTYFDSVQFFIYHYAKIDKNKCLIG